MSILPGLMTVSYNHSLRAGKISPSFMIERAQELGLKSTEWCHFPCHEPGKVDWDQVRLLDRLGRERGIMNSIAGWAPLLAEDDRREVLLGRVKIQLEVSKFIGADRLRFHSSIESEIGIGTQPPMQLVIENLNRVIELAEEVGVTIALENHGDLRIADFRCIFEAIDSPFLGINLDTGNFVPLQEDVVAFAREFKDKIVSCHFKAVHYIWTTQGIILTSCRVRDSLVDLRAILDVLHESNRTIPAHVEVIPLNFEEEDPLVTELAVYVHAYLADKTS